jgi:hypothetical protein
MVGEVIGALGEEHRRLVAQDDRDQHRRGGGSAVDDALLDLDLGCHAGGATKRSRIAAGRMLAASTGGRWESSPRPAGPRD